MTDRIEPKYIVSYETPDPADGWQEEYEWVPPVVGHGVVDERGNRWRIKDVWVIHEKRGAYEYGVYAFLEPPQPADDRLANLRPEYYRA